MMQLTVERTQLSAIVEKIIASIQTLADERGVTIIAPSDDIEVVADKDKLERVLMNLLANAIKYSPKGSRITITAGVVPGWTEITVTDEGRGIPKEALEHIFDRFQQVERDDEVVHGGSGLGLAICKAIIEAHKGEITVESELDKGSKFRIRLPV
jgi:signal transduction histidine kinase